MVAWDVFVEEVGRGEVEGAAGDRRGDGDGGAGVLCFV